MGDNTRANFESWKIKNSDEISAIREKISNRRSSLEKKQSENESRLNNQINEHIKLISDLNNIKFNKLLSKIFNKILRTLKKGNKLMLIGNLKI